MPKSMILIAAVVGHHDVGRLDVAVDDAGAMRVLERGQDLIDDVGRALGLQSPRIARTACRAFRRARTP